MSDPRETLADEVVRTAMIQLGRDTPVGFWAPTENATRKAVTAVLRELAAKPDGYLRYEEDGGITYTKTLRSLADEIEAPTTNPEPPANECAECSRSGDHKMSCSGRARPVNPHQENPE